MKDSVMNAGLATVFNHSLYDKLIDLSIADAEDSDEYTSITSRLIENVSTENKEYDKLDIETIDEWLSLLDKSNEPNRVNERFRIKLLSRKRKILNPKYNKGVFGLNEVISTKLSIDTLKRLDQKVDEFIDKGNVSDIDISTISEYYRVFKYNIFLSNNYFELLGLDKEFKIKDISPLSFENIEKEFGVNFVDNSRRIFLGYVKGAINDLSVNFGNGDIYAKSIFQMFSVARIESILPYVNVQDLDYLISYIDDNDSDSIAMRHVKKLIKKKKDELDN